MTNRWHSEGDHFAVELWQPGSDCQARRKNLHALVDAHGLTKMQAHSGTWGAGASRGNRTYYVIGTVKGEGKKRKRLSLHRLVTDCPDGLEPDHLNHDGLDNRLDNLKVGTHLDNIKTRRPKLPKLYCDKCRRPLDVSGFVYCSLCMWDAAFSVRSIPEVLPIKRTVLRSRNFMKLEIFPRSA